MRYYIIAGEASGDLHASNLMKALVIEDKDASFRMWGGDLMKEVGGELVKHYRDLAFMGFLEVAKNIYTIFRNFAFCKKDITAFNPDVIIFVDYPGFNLRIAKWAKKRSYNTFYYISPQIWAWNSSRVHSIKKVVDRMFVILPFEKAFYEKYSYAVDFVGHPLLDVVVGFKPSIDFYIKNKLSTKKPIIALLPGSRKQEITKLLEHYLAIIPSFPQYQFVIAAAPSQELSFYQKILNGFCLDNSCSVSIIQNQTYDLLYHSKAALVTSGTATLEAALFSVPQVVCYKGSAISYQIAKRLINVSYISLVNLIMDDLIVEELIQNDLTVPNLQKSLEHILDDKHRKSLQESYLQLHEKLGNDGASIYCANLMVSYLKKK